MLTRSSFSQSAARQHGGHPGLGWRGGSRRLPESYLAARGARPADAPLAGDFPVFPPVRRRHFGRRDRGEHGDFPLFALAFDEFSSTRDPTRTHLVPLIIIGDSNGLGLRWTRHGPA